MPFAATWMQLEINIQSQSERQIPYDITYMQSLKYDTNEPIYQTQTHGHRELTCGWPRGRGVSRYKLLEIKQGPIVQQRELYSLSDNKP